MGSTQRPADSLPAEWVPSIGSDSEWRSEMRWFGYCRLLLAASLLWVAPPVPAQSAAPVIHLSVDLHEAPRRIFHARLVLPARPGPMTLLYPEWIPGEPAPDGPAGERVGLRPTAGGKTTPR